MVWMSYLLIAGMVQGAGHLGRVIPIQFNGKSKEATQLGSNFVKGYIVNKRAIPLATIFLCASGLSAQTNDFRYGVEAVLNTPSSALRDLSSRSGLGAACTLDWEISNGRVLRSRVGFNASPEKSSSSFVLFDLGTIISHSSSSAKSSEISVNYMYYPSGQAHGWHLDGGIAVMRYHIKFNNQQTVSYNNPPGYILLGGEINKTKTKPGIALGVGYDFNRNFGLGTRFTSVEIDGGRFNAYSVGIGYRF